MMGKNRFWTILGVGTAVALLSGCMSWTHSSAAGRQKTVSETTRLQEQVALLSNEVTSLKARLEEQAWKQDSLGQELASLQDKQRTTPARRIFSNKLSARQIQKALVAAGFYTGPIDGKLGPKTGKAIKAFQRSEGLKVDGVVGRKTRTALNGYL